MPPPANDDESRPYPPSSSGARNIVSAPTPSTLVNSVSKRAEEKLEKLLDDENNRLTSSQLNSESCKLSERPEQRSNQNKFNDKPRGWYASRRAYRSVAYRTWKVGSARQLLAGNSDICLAGQYSSDTEEYYRRNARTILTKGSIPSSASYGPDANLYDSKNPGGINWRSFYATQPRREIKTNNSRMCTSSDNFWRRGNYSQESSETLTDFSTSPVARTYWREGTMTLSDQEGPMTDCFSAEDYCKFKYKRMRNGLRDRPCPPPTRKKRENLYSSTTSTDFSDDADGETSDENALAVPLNSNLTDLDQSLQSVMENFRQLQNYVTMRPKKTKIDNRPRALALHRRSHSAGSAAVFCATATPIKSINCKIIDDLNNNEKPKQTSGHFGSLSATKRFLKRLYRSHNKPEPAGPKQNGEVKQKATKEVKKASLAIMETSSDSSSPRSLQKSPQHIGANPPRFTDNVSTIRDKKIGITGQNGYLLPEFRKSDNQSPHGRNNFTSLDDAYYHLKEELVRACSTIISSLPC